MSVSFMSLSFASIRRYALFAFVVAACTALSVLAYAQQATPRLGQPEGAAGQPAMSEPQTAARVPAPITSPTDRLVAGMLYHLYFEEEAISRFAIDRAHDSSVREFAQKMVAQHQGDLEKLRQIVSLPDSGRWPQAKNEPARRPFATGAMAGAGATAADPMSIDDPIRLFHDLAQSHVQTVEQHFAQYHGAKFDDAYIGHELDDHLKIIGQLRVLQAHASPKLQQFIGQGLTVAERHLHQANQIMDRLAEHAATAQAHERSSQSTQKR
jgi:predicted outer membrane protein